MSTVELAWRKKICDAEVAAIARGITTIPIKRRSLAEMFKEVARVSQVRGVKLRINHKACGVGRYQPKNRVLVLSPTGVSFIDLWLLCHEFAHAKVEAGHTRQFLATFLYIIGKVFSERMRQIFSEELRQRGLGEEEE